MEGVPPSGGAAAVPAPGFGRRAAAPAVADALRATVSEPLVKRSSRTLRVLRSQTVPQPLLWTTSRRPNSALPSAVMLPPVDHRHTCSAADHDAIHDICVRVGGGIAVSVFAVIEVPPPVPPVPSTADNWLFGFFFATL